MPGIFQLRKVSSGGKHELTLVLVTPVHTGLLMVNFFFFLINVVTDFKSNHKWSKPLSSLITPRVNCV
jgi:hypothetical protein